MHYFYTDQALADVILIEGEDGRHAFVLRIKIGEEVGILNGKGRVITGIAENITKQSFLIRVIDYKIIPRPILNVHLAISPTKQIDRFEWLLEKATEFGVQMITPLICEHTDRIVYKYDRWHKIIVSALKQSGRPYLPVLNQAASWGSFVNQPTSQLPYLAHITGESFRNIEIIEGDTVTICIGPEGDFSPTELNEAKMLKLPFLSFGPYRLRTETAGLLAAAYFSH